MKPFKKSGEVPPDRHIAAISAPVHDSVPPTWAIDYAAAAQSVATTTGYAADMRHFVKFGGAIPALSSCYGTC